MLMLLILMMPSPSVAFKANGGMNGPIYVESDHNERMEVMEELARREILVLKEIHLTGETSDKTLANRFIENDIVVDVGSLLLTHKGLGLLVRGSPALWDVAA